MGFTPKTLADYDAVLSVSEEAVNRHMQILWSTEINPPKDKNGKVADLPVTRVRNHVPPPRAKYLINHDISIHTLIDDTDEYGDPIPGKKIKSPSGIDGHILAPRVTFTEDPRYVRFSLRFFTDESVITDTDPELKNKTLKERQHLSKSWLKAFSVDTGKMVSADLTGYEASWKCKLGTRHIQNVMEELIKPAESPNDPTTAAQGLIDKMKDILPQKRPDDTVPPEDFLVSAMFCLFEANDAMEGFRITDSDGKDIQGATFVSLMGLIVEYFESMKTSEAAKPGIPNPNSPFVLGYGISQKLPSLAETNSRINRDKTPKYFIPKRFDLTATKGTSNATKGTLNYCMITHRDVDSSGKEENREDVDLMTNKNAGNLTPDFFSLTKMSSANSDAVMAFSSNCFLQRFVFDTLFKALHIDLEPAFNHWQTFANGHAENKNDVTYNNDGDPVVVYGDWSQGKQDVQRCVKIQRRQTCRSNKGEDAVEFDIPTMSPYRVKSWQEGFSETNMIVESDLAKNTSGDATLPDDVQRSIRITCTMASQLKFYIETHLRGPAGNWSEAYTTEIKTRHNIVFDLTASTEGTWNVTINKSLTHCPSDANEFYNSIVDTSAQSLINGVLQPRIAPPQPTGECFATIHHGFLNFFSYLDFLFAAIASDDPMSKFQKEMFTNQIGNSMDKVNAIMQGFDHTVIMPGGEAFSFTGLDTDAEGAVYSHLTYKAGASGATQKVDPRAA